MRSILWAAVAAGLLVAVAHADTLDQESAATNQQFNMDAVFLTWEQEVVVGIAGPLVRLELNTQQPGNCTLFLQPGAPWQPPPPPYSVIFSSDVAGWKSVDVRAANMTFNVGDHFVLGFIGGGTGMWLGGSYNPPHGGYPPGELYLNDAFFSDGGFDIAFRTYVENTPPVCHGDTNCDGQINFADINPFVLALTDLAQWQAQYPNCPVGNVDVNGDGQVNFGDINPFVALLSGGGSCE